MTCSKNLTFSYTLFIISRLFSRDFSSTVPAQNREPIERESGQPTFGAMKKNSRSLAEITAAMLGLPSETWAAESSSFVIKNIPPRTEEWD